MIADGVVLGGGIQGCRRERVTELLDRVGLPAMRPRGTRTSSAAANGNGSPSPARWPPNRSAWWRTSRSAPWTPRRRPRSPTCSAIWSARRATAWSSSPTTCRWSARSPTGSRSCTWAGSSKSAPPRGSGPSLSHPYTEALMAAIPRADGGGVLPVDLPGDVPDPASPPSGCRFHPRCPIAEDACTSIDQRLAPIDGREVACQVRAPAEPEPARPAEPSAARTIRTLSRPELLLCGW